MDGENKPRKMAMHGPVRTGPAFYDAYSMAPHSRNNRIPSYYGLLWHLIMGSLSISNAPTFAIHVYQCTSHKASPSTPVFNE